MKLAVLFTAFALASAPANSGEIADRLWQLAENASGPSAGQTQGQVQPAINAEEAALSKEQKTACATSCSGVLTPCTFNSSDSDNCTPCKHTKATAANNNRTYEGNAYKPGDSGWVVQCNSAKK